VGDRAGAPPLTLAGRLLDVYGRLYAAYGPQRWWPGETPFEVIVGAILTQSAAWTNVEKAIANLKAAGALSPEGLARLDEGELARMVYPAGYFNAKARKLKAFVEMLRARFGGDPSTPLRTGLERMLAASVEELRPLLLATHGIGPETADAVLLYAAGRPVFVIDAYARRLLSRLDIAPDRDTYNAWQALFARNLEPDAALFNEYHALIVLHGKERCRRLPICDGCPLLAVCPTGQSGQKLQTAGQTSV
jgi:endonuclease-3 related protein